MYGLNVIRAQPCTTFLYRTDEWDHVFQLFGPALFCLCVSLPTSVPLSGSTPGGMTFIAPLLISQNAAIAVLAEMPNCQRVATDTCRLINTHRHIHITTARVYRIHAQLP